MAGLTENTLRSRPVRIGVTIVLAAAGLWAFAPYAMNDIATQAAINAPLIRMLAPVDGTVAALPVQGTYFSVPRQLPLVLISGDVGPLGVAAAEAERAESRARLARHQIAEIAAEESRLGTRALLFRSAAIAHLGARLQAAGAETESCTSRRAEADAALARATHLRSTGFLAPVGLDKARTETARVQADCKGAAARRSAIQTEVAAAGRGVLLADGANDQPYSTQQKDRLGTERRQLEAIALEAEARAASERQRISSAHARATQPMPAGLYVWDVMASPGSAVPAGAPLVDLADCRRRFVDVALPERRAATLRAGDRARIRLVGSDDWVEGRVLRLAGSAARTETALLAAYPQARPDGREISVIVSLPPFSDPSGSADAQMQARRCDIGRLAEVRFSRVSG